MVEEDEVMGVFVPPTLDSVSNLMQLLWRNPIPTTANGPPLPGLGAQASKVGPLDFV